MGGWGRPPSSASINALEIREMGGGLAGEPTSGSGPLRLHCSFTLPNTECPVSAVHQIY